MIGAGDNIGSGFPTILNAWGEENWRKPDLSENQDLRLVELKLWMVSLMPQECTDHLGQLFGTIYTHLSSNEQIILGTAYLEGSVTNSRLQSMLNLHSIEIGHVLADLVEAGMLITDNKRRWASYHLNENYEKQSEQLGLEDIHSGDVKLRNKTDQAIYDYIRANGFITTSQVISITRITTTAGASVALGRLIDAGLVVMVRKSRHVIYQLSGNAQGTEKLLS